MVVWSSFSIFLIYPLFLSIYARKYDLHLLKKEIDLPVSYFNLNRSPFTHNYPTKKKRNNDRKNTPSSLYDTILSNFKSSSGDKNGEEREPSSSTMNDQKLRTRLQRIFIMADDFEANSEILSFYGNSTINNLKLFHPEVSANNISYYDIYTDFNNIYDTESSMMDMSANITIDTHNDFNTGSEYMYNGSWSNNNNISTDYDDDDSYYDRDLHLQYAQMYNDTAPLDGLDGYDSGHSAYDDYKDDYADDIGDARAYTNDDVYDRYNDPDMEEAYIDPDGQGHINRKPAHTTTPKDTKHSESSRARKSPSNSNNNNNNYQQQNGFTTDPLGADPIIDAKIYEEIIIASYEAEIIQFYDKQENPINQSLLIYGRDILTNMSLLSNILDYRIDSNTIIMIGGHGTLVEGNHVIDFMGYYDDSSQLLATTDLILALQSIHSVDMRVGLNSSGSSSDDNSHNSVSKEVNYQPMQIHLDSCYAGDVAYQLANILYKENTIVTNSKHQFPSISSLSSLKHKFLLDAVVSTTNPTVSSTSTNDDIDSRGSSDNSSNQGMPVNPYELFLQSIELEAVQYAKFITSKDSSSQSIHSNSQNRGKNSNQRQRKTSTDSRYNKKDNGIDDYDDSEEYIFSLSPPFQVLRSTKTAGKYLSKQVSRFIKFSKSKTWNHQPIVLEKRVFTKEQINSFCGNLFLYLCAIGEPEFISFLDTHTQSLDYMFIVSLFNHHAFGDYAIHMAVSFGHISIVQIYLDLLYTFSQKNFRSVYHIKDDDGFIPSGFDVNLRNRQGLTPVYIASQYGFIDIIELFIEQGADINLPCYRGTTALFAASAVGHVDVVDYLLSNQADINISDKDGTAAFHMACQNNHIEVVKKLLLFSSNFDINHSKHNGNTALHMASIRGNIDILRLLLDYNVNIHVKNDNHVTPLMMATQEGYIEIVRLLLDHGADVNTQTLKGTTALFIASAYGYTLIVKLLLERGADASIRTNDGFSPIAIAYQEGYDDIRDLLLKVSSNKMCDERRCYT